MKFNCVLSQRFNRSPKFRTLQNLVLCINDTFPIVFLMFKINYSTSLPEV